VPTAEGSGVRIHYEVVGDGPPLVLHTGLLGDSRMWRDAGYVEALHGFRLVLVDHRGHGRSDRPAGLDAHRIERYAADVVAVLDALSIERAAFLGYSDGARVGYVLAAADPMRVAALVALGVPGLHDAGERRELAELAALVRASGTGGLVDELERDEAPLPAWLRAHFLETDAEMAALELEAWARHWEGPWPLFETIEAPTLIVVGEGEDPDGQAERAVRAMRDGRHVVLPGVGHLGAFLRPDLVGPPVRDFLAARRRETMEP
jgi:pimeloyl-ACP methyl ester carboxylesterase